MKMQVGEVVDAWLEQDEKDMAKILDMNGHVKDPYWVILFHQIFPNKGVHFNGGKPFVRVLKAFFTKPRPLVGAHIAEVNNASGKITWRVYPKDIPVDWEKITDNDLTQRNLIHECDIPKSYIYNTV